MSDEECEECIRRLATIQNLKRIIYAQFALFLMMVCLIITGVARDREHLDTIDKLTSRMELLESHNNHLLLEVNLLTLSYKNMNDRLEEIIIQREEGFKR